MYIPVALPTESPKHVRHTDPSTTVWFGDGVTCRYDLARTAQAVVPRYVWYQVGASQVLYYVGNVFDSGSAYHGSAVRGGGRGGIRKL